MAEIDELRNKVKEYERRMGIGVFDPAKDGYLVLVEILRQQNEYLKDFKIRSFIASEEKGDMAAYKNAKDMWEGLPKMIQSVSNLRMELKMDGEEKKTIYTPLSASAIARGEADV